MCIVMKKTLVIVVHPTLHTSKINKAWSEAARGHTTLHFLYDAYPEGKPFDVASEQALVEAHDRIVFQFPLYWYAAPYLLKKWLDEVITFGWAYGEGGDKMEGKEIAVAVSCGGKEDQFTEGGIQCHTLAHYMQVFDGIAAFVRGKYIGFHALYDSYNPAIDNTLEENCTRYIQFLKQD